VIVFLKLGYSSLWIDSLCILQDSVDDWEEEAAAMRDVYSNGVCNIAAIDSENNEAGQFARRNLLALRPCLIRGRPGENLEVRTSRRRVRPDRSGKEIPSPSKSGWVVQELALSPMDTLLLLRTSLLGML
jgi:Heterokaryon incompatibility protein (HET)